MLAHFLDYPDWGDRFLLQLEEHGLLHTAARAVGTTAKQVQRYRDNNAEFDAAVRDALELSTDTLEREARRRGVDGVVKGVYYQGDLVATEVVYSDTLLSKMLDAKRRQEFGNKVDVRHGGSITVMIRDFAQDPETGEVIDAEFTPVHLTNTLAPMPAPPPRTIEISVDDLV